jgi:hypothetical protein
MVFPKIRNASWSENRLMADRVILSSTQQEQVFKQNGKKEIG